MQSLAAELLQDIICVRKVCDSIAAKQRNFRVMLLYKFNNTGNE